MDSSGEVDDPHEQLGLRREHVDGLQDAPVLVIKEQVLVARGQRDDLPLVAKASEMAYAWIWNAKGVPAHFHSFEISPFATKYVTCGGCLSLKKTYLENFIWVVGQSKRYPERILSRGVYAKVRKSKSAYFLATPPTPPKGS